MSEARNARRAWWLPHLGPAVVALLALAGTLATLDPGGSGPGVTCDEYYDVAVGKRLVNHWRQWGLGIFRQPGLEATFGGTTLHPPLGRWLLGWAHAPFDPDPGEPYAVSVVGGRFAPALAFALLVWLTGEVARAAGGDLAGTVAALALATVPRALGDAHQATLDTFTALFCAAALWALPWAHRVAPSQTPGNQQGERRGLGWTGPWAAGFVWGLALLTKFHGFTLVVPAALWFVWRLRLRALGPGLAWLAGGGLVFWIGWPWLWIKVPQHLITFLSASTDRQPLRVFYWGKAWIDRDVPWHYPWVMFAVTVPVAWLALGGWGMWTQRRRLLTDPRLSATLLGWLFPLVLFSWPGVPVYDGIRLFLSVLPNWAVLAGLGAAELVAAAPREGRARALRLGGVALVCATPLVGVIGYAPVWLSHYNALVGGLRGAVALGFEATYWGDAVDGPLLAATTQVPQGGLVLYTPHLAPFQAQSVAASSRVLDRIELRGWDPNQRTELAACRWALVYRRRADEDQYDWLLGGSRVVAQTTCAGVWLARLIELPRPLGELAPPAAPQVSTPTPRD